MAFLVIEGIDGAGKTTLIKSLLKALRKKGITPLLTREPGGTKTGKQIRRILLEKAITAPTPLTEILLYYADRSQNISENIKPALRKGKWVISDRYWASTLAYQHGGRGTGKKFIDSLTLEICGKCQPDVWILLDIPIKESQARLNRQEQKDRFEEEKLIFHKKVRTYYLQLAKNHPEKWLVLSGSKSQKELVEKILKYLIKKKLIEDSPSKLEKSF